MNHHPYQGGVQLDLEGSELPQRHPLEGSQHCLTSYSLAHQLQLRRSIGVCLLRW